MTKIVTPREEHHEEAVFEEVVLLDLAAAGIDQIGDLLKGKEGDPERQQDVLQDEIGLEQLVGRLDEEIGVFEIAEHREIDDDAEGQQQRHPIAAAHLPIGGEPARDQEIKQREAEQQRHIDRIPPAVKKDRGGQQQPQHGARPEQLPHRDIGGHRRRQKQE
jgi:hypothetical protein